MCSLLIHAQVNAHSEINKDILFHNCLYSKLSPSLIIHKISTNKKKQPSPKVIQWFSAQHSKLLQIINFYPQQHWAQGESGLYLIEK